MLAFFMLRLWLSDDESIIKSCTHASKENIHRIQIKDLSKCDVAS
jgi:hypothetical protein